VLTFTLTTSRSKPNLEQGMESNQPARIGQRRVFGIRGGRCGVGALCAQCPPSGGGRTFGIAGPTSCKEIESARRRVDIPIIASLQRRKRATGPARCAGDRAAPGSPARQGDRESRSASHAVPHRCRAQRRRTGGRNLQLRSCSPTVLLSATFRSARWGACQAFQLHANPGFFFFASSSSTLGRCSCWTWC